jgi:hypothetical protein
MNCHNDPVYTKRILTTYYLNIFPPKNVVIKCYVPIMQQNYHKTTDLDIIDALHYLPDQLAYRCSLTVLIFGTLMGFLFIIFGFKFEIKSPLIYKSIFENFMKEINENNFKLNDSMINFNNKDVYNEPPMPQFEQHQQQQESDDNTIELTNFSQNGKNNLTINDNISRNRSLSHEDFMKLSNAGYHFGRVGYPGCSKFSCNASLRSSLDSLCYSLKDDSDHSYDGPVFYLDVKNSSDKCPSPDQNYPNIHIPQSIVEEDENSTNFANSANDVRVRKSKPSSLSSLVVNTL